MKVLSSILGGNRTTNVYYFTSTYQTFAKNLYVFYSYRASEETRMVSSFHSVVVITSALHAEGPQFDPERVETASR